MISSALALPVADRLGLTGSEEGTTAPVGAVEGVEVCGKSAMTSPYLIDDLSVVFNQLLYASAWYLLRVFASVAFSSLSFKTLSA